MMKGKLETQFSAAEDPDWKALRNRTEAGAVDVVTVRDGPKQDGHPACLVRLEA